MVGLLVHDQSQGQTFAFVITFTLLTIKNGHRITLLNGCGFTKQTGSLPADLDNRDVPFIDFL